METFPAKRTYQNDVAKRYETLICYAYENDLYQLYDFYCARYENITYDEFLNLGINYFNIKLMSIPESEPLYTILKARTINLGKIKDKDEKRYWRELKRQNSIPAIYLPKKEIDMELKKKVGDFKHGKGT